MQTEGNVLRRARMRQADIFADMDRLSVTYGADVFRISGQRYFKWARDRAALQREIAAKEAELAKLREKVAS